MEFNNTCFKLHEAASAPGLGRRLVSMLFAIGGLASIKMGCSRRVFVGAADEFIARGFEGEVRVEGVGNDCDRREDYFGFFFVRRET